MKTRRQRVWLTAVAVAGSIALYGCGGGSDGPDTTPFDQQDLDKAAADAKAKEEARQAAIATATEAAKEAATAASAAATAQRAAAAAASAATDAAKYETLDADEAEAQSTAAANAKAAADTALAAANDALAKANAVNHSDQAVTDLKTAAQSSAADADASAKAAAGSASEADRQAKIARATQNGIDNNRLAAQKQGEQRQIAADKAGDAAEAADTAADKATEAKEEAEDALPAAQAAQDALADDATDAQKEAAQKAVDDAEKRDADYKTRAENAAAAAAAAEAARDAAKTASEEAAAAALAAGDTDPASEGAMLAAEAAESYTAARLSAIVAQGWSDVLAITKTYKDTDATEASLDDLLKIIPWAKDQARAGDVSVLEGVARVAAENLEQQSDPDSDAITAYQDTISQQLAIVTTDANNVAGALAAARADHDAAKPWSENGHAVDNATGAEGETLASGDILINTDGRISLGGAKERVVADVNTSVTDQGQFDLDRNNRGIVSFSSKVGDETTGYQMIQNNRYGTGPDKVFDHLSYGVWSAIPVQEASTNVIIAAGTGGGAFALLDDDAPAASADVIGTAKFSGNHVSIVATETSTTTDGVTTTTVSTAIHEGSATASVTFGSDESSVKFTKVTPDPNNAGQTVSADWYQITDLKISGNMLSGGEYDAIQATPEIADDADDALNVHVGVFGALAEEIGGTVSVENSAGGITINTAFGARNDDHD